MHATRRTRRGRRERLDTEHPAVAVNHSGNVNVKVGVYPASDLTRLYDDGHRHPFLFKLVKGWHARPGKETVTIGLRQQADRSPSGTGRAHVGADGTGRQASQHARCHQSVRPQPSSR